MAGVASKVAVIGSGTDQAFDISRFSVSGAVCASILAKNGISVTVFESARGPGGRMSQRREHSEDGRELLFDHGAPYFSVNSSNLEVQSVLNDWESRGLVAEWKEKFGSFDFRSKTFVEESTDPMACELWLKDLLMDSMITSSICDWVRKLAKSYLQPGHKVKICFSRDAQVQSTLQEGSNKKYVGVPGMNSICRALCHEPGVESRFGLGIGRVAWLEDDEVWSLKSLDGQDVGHFKGVVASDKNTFSSRFTHVTGKPPPIDLSSVFDTALQIQEIPAIPCFALMLAFEQPLSSIPTKGLSFKNSEVISWAHCDSSKPGRSTTSERWVLHSTPKYAQRIISEMGLEKPSNAVLAKVADDLFQEFERTGLNISEPFFKKAHRWGSAFPAASIAGEEKCLWFGKRRLAICGDFCVSPNVEGAICSGIAASANFIKVLSTL